MATRFHGGRIYLGNELYAEEIFCSDQGLVCTREEFLGSSEQNTIDLNGQFLLPAFVDSHSHPLFAGREAAGLDINHAKSIEELTDLLQSHRNSQPSLTWLDAAVYDRSIPGVPDRHTLDAAVSDIPVVLHVDDHHTLLVNTKALEVAGLMSGEVPALASGSVDIGPDGLPTGVLREWPAMSLVMDLAPKNSLEQDVQVLIQAEQRLISEGIVQAQDAWIDKGMAEVYLEADARALLQLTYNLCFRADPETFESDLPYILQMNKKLTGTKHLKAQAIKFFVDGVFGSATAAVVEPYHSNGKNGELLWSKTSLIDAISLAHLNGFQSHIHAIGDLGVAAALSALSKATPAPDLLSPVIAHAELTNDELLLQVKSLDVFVCMQPYWAQENGMLLSCQSHLGKERLNSLYAIRDMLENGLTVAFSSDWPVSTPSVIKGMTVAVFRREHHEQTAHNPSQATSLHQAISSYTTGGHKLLGNPLGGTLNVGEQFNAVLINHFLNESDLDSFTSAKVTSTFLLGKDLLIHN